jgi:hypothetical protein
VNLSDKREAKSAEMKYQTSEAGFTPHPHCPDFLRKAEVLSLKNII